VASELLIDCNDYFLNMFPVAALSEEATYVSVYKLIICFPFSVLEIGNRYGKVQRSNPSDKSLTTNTN
jgi:hypothetical protein